MEPLQETSCLIHLGIPTSLLGKAQYFCENEAGYLAGIFASLQEANTDHVVGDFSRVGSLTVSLRQHWGIQALEQVWVVHFEERIRKKCDSDQDGHQCFKVETTQWTLEHASRY